MYMFAKRSDVYRSYITLLESVSIPMVFEEQGERLRSMIASAILIALGAGEREAVEAFHISNAAMQGVEDLFLLDYSYEDSNIEGMQAAEQFYALLNALAPGAFVLIQTGDYISASCYQPVGEHAYCETYDFDYHVYLMRREDFERQRDAIMARDAAWDAEQKRCHLLRTETA